MQNNSEQAEAEVVPSSRLIEVKLEVGVEVEVQVEVGVEFQVVVEVWVEVGIEVRVDDWWGRGWGWELEVGS